MITRRQSLALPLLIVSVREALATPAEAQALLNEFTGGREPRRGKVTLDIPQYIEDGHFVPVSVAVESAMTMEDHCRRLILIAGNNPWPGIATFGFSPLSGEAFAKTRIRLAATQMVQAVAEMGDGTFWVDRKTVEVTIGGCAG